MDILPTKLPGAYILQSKLIRDDRGYFIRLFCSDSLRKAGLESRFNQINCSLTLKAGCIRGLHYQVAPMAETKVVRCVRGRVWDVMVDLRKNSPSFLKWQGIELSEHEDTMVYVPAGFAHGIQALENESQIVYASSVPYSPQYEKGIRFSDPLIAVQWPILPQGLSDKDSNLPLLEKNFSGVEE
jgi:dTDP-4-dehydrorhamnose 3,5-epimerase